MLEATRSNQCLLGLVILLAGAVRRSPSKWPLAHWFLIRPLQLWPLSLVEVDAKRGEVF